MGQKGFITRLDCFLLLFYFFEKIRFFLFDFPNAYSDSPKILSLFEQAHIHHWKNKREKSRTIRNANNMLANHKVA